MKPTHKFLGLFRYLEPVKTTETKIKRLEKTNIKNILQTKLLQIQWALLDRMSMGAAQSSCRQACPGAQKFM
jgi:hypothetical protein